MPSANSRTMPTRSFLSRIVPMATALSVVLVVAGCDSTLSDEANARLRSSSQKWNAQDADGWLQLVSENATFVPADHAPIKGRTSIGEWLRAQQQSAPQDKIIVAPIQIYGHLDIAFVRGAYTRTKNGAVTELGTYDEGWHKEADGVWRIIRDDWKAGQPN